jgi:hypothetical protein
MYVVAGPAGSGKSTAFPGDGFGCDYFNADNYAAMLNGGSYVGIPKSIRAEVAPFVNASFKITLLHARALLPKQHCGALLSSIKSNRPAKLGLRSGLLMFASRTQVFQSGV